MNFTRSPELLQTLAANPMVFALANPEPEIAYELALATRPDLIMATGRSDHPNQVNNVLGFPTSSGARWTCGPPKSTRP